MSRENLAEILDKLEWAYVTLRDKVKFGMPEDQAVYRREARARGVLCEAVKELTKLYIEMGIKEPPKTQEKDEI